jgi:hypothetical protein
LFTRFPHLTHLSLSGKSLAEDGTLDLTKLWGQGTEQAPWATKLETFTVDCVELSRVTIHLTIQLPVDLRITNAVFREKSFNVFKKTTQLLSLPGGCPPERARNSLRSAMVSGLVIITDETLGRYDRVWVVGSEFAAAEAVKPYSKCAHDPKLLDDIPRMQSEGVEKYIVSGGPSPLTLQNM